ncbi:MAG TPA: LD-carboxypeptidase [Bacteroidales bacterium]|nr:LD-carboxypeptidase [Bacteroidales bacterium]
MPSPEYLKKGDKVGIIAPARKISKEEIEPAFRMLESWGLHIVNGKSLFKASDQFAGTDEERATDLQQMIDDVSVRAIICCRGGYGTVRLFDKVNFVSFFEAPKWLVGFSDITVLHSLLHSLYDAVTLHAQMPINFPKNGIINDSVESLRKALFGETITYQANPNPLNRTGLATGTLIGGNLSVLASLSGTLLDIDTSNKILFIEDLDEYLYHVDRMMINLKLSGKLTNLKGLIVGGMTGMRDNEIPFGKTAEEIIREAVEEFEYPVCFNFPAGHQEPNMALYLGREIEMNVTEELSVIEYTEGSSE